LSVVNVLIAFGVLGIINGFAIYNSRYYEDLIREHQLPFYDKLENKLNPNKPIVGTIYGYGLFLTMFIICTIVGVFGYTDTNGYAYTSYFATYSNICSLYSFVDLMAN